MSEAGAIVDAAASDGGPGPRPSSSISRGRVGAEPFVWAAPGAGFGTTSATVSAGDLRFFITTSYRPRGIGRGGPRASRRTSGRTRPSGSSIRRPHRHVHLRHGRHQRRDHRDGPRGRLRRRSFHGGDAATAEPRERRDGRAAATGEQAAGHGPTASFTSSFEFRSNKTLELGDGGVKAMDPFYAQYRQYGLRGCSGDGRFHPGARTDRGYRSGFHPATSKTWSTGRLLYIGPEPRRQRSRHRAGMHGRRDGLDCPPMFERLGLDFVKGTSPPGEPRDLQRRGAMSGLSCGPRPLALPARRVCDTARTRCGCPITLRVFSVALLFS